MTERDPLHALLREWHSPEPTSELNDRVIDVYRAEFRTGEDRSSIWQQVWKTRVSVPVPILGAAIILLALLFWLHSAPVPSIQSDTAGVVTRLNGTGFQPLPNGHAQIVPIKETHQ